MGMAVALSAGRNLSVSGVIFALLAIGAIAGGVAYIKRPAPQATSDEGGVSAEAKAYLSNLELSGVTMQATENFMNQQVVEVQGKIANHGPRKLALIEVYCLFSGVNGKEIHRERVPVVRGLAPNETRAFRLPFDSLPTAWNQAMPHLVIAKIVFAT